MKKLTMKELLQKTVKELVKMRNDLKKDLYDLKIKNSLRALDKTHLIKLARKNIARVNTTLNSKLS